MGVVCNMSSFEGWQCILPQQKERININNIKYKQYKKLKFGNPCILLLSW